MKEGAALAFSAARERLFAATELNEWAWQARPLLRILFLRQSLNFFGAVVV